MTTTVYDRENKVIAADTRWSALINSKDGSKLLAFTDESSFEKIADRPNSTMVMAGDGQLIAEWKRWWFESLDSKSMPAFEKDGKTAIVLLIINKKKNKWIFETGEKLASVCTEKKEVNAIFSGSGSATAATTWIECRCAKTAIKLASVLDPMTGEIVRFVDFENSQSNIENSSYDYNDIVTSLIHGGFIMTLHDNNVVPIKEHPLAKEITDLFTSGSVVASAPMPELKKFVWNDEQKDKLKAAIDEVRELEGLD